jgi:DRG Family Regulatory Proteins, Tma46
VLKSQRKALEEAEKANTISLEEFLEVEVRPCSPPDYKSLSIHDDNLRTQRHKLGSNLTPVTRETFAKWKQTRMSKKEAEADAVRKTKDAQAAAGKNSGMSGRDLFQYNPEWFQDLDEEEDDWDLSKYRRQKEDEDLAAEAERIRLLSIHGGDP